MSTGSCADFDESRSAYVDGALVDGDRERLLRHLSACASCRQDVAELRAVRRLLGGSSPSVAPPSHLSSRLVSIAGNDASEPLRVRSFRHRGAPPGPRSAGLPSRRRVHRARLAAVSVTVGAAVAMATTVGYLAAPPDIYRSIDDPTSEARAAFTATLGQFPLTSDSMAAVMTADQTRLRAGGPAPGLGPSMPRGAALDPSAAAAAMKRAALADQEVSYTGRQTFTVYRDGQAVTAELEVEARAGQGIEYALVGRGAGTGRDTFIPDRFSPSAVSVRPVDDELLELLGRNFSLTAARGAFVAQRPAMVVAAFRDGVVAARWWVDDVTGMLLWQETYDATGSPDLSYGFTSVSMDPGGGISQHLPARLVVPSTTSALTLSDGARLEQSGWACPRELAELSLVRLRSDGSGDPSALHLVYSDGIATATVFEQRGNLVGGPDGSSWDTELGAHVEHGVTEVASWQSGNRVYTVVTDGSEDLLQAVVDSLPHEAARTPTTMGRVKAGWAKIAAEMKG